MRGEYRIKRWNSGKNVIADELRSQMEREGYYVYRWSDEPGRVYGTHSHGEDQSHWIISGELELRVEDFGKVILKAGDRDFMPAGTDHSARVLGDEAVVYLIGEKR